MRCPHMHTKIELSGVFDNRDTAIMALTTNMDRLNKKGYVFTFGDVLHTTDGKYEVRLRAESNRVTE